MATKTDSLIDRSARVDAVNRKTFASYRGLSARAADPSANGTTTPERITAMSSTTAVVKATPTVSTTPMNVSFAVKEFDRLQPVQQRLHTSRILVNRIVKMNENVSENVNVNKIENVKENVKESESVILLQTKEVCLPLNGKFLVRIY